MNAGIEYVCAECGKTVVLSLNDGGRVCCDSCKHKVLFKKRKNEPQQYFAI